MKKSILILLTVLSVTSFAQVEITRKFEVSESTQESCELTNKNLAQNIADQTKGLNVTNIRLGECHEISIFEPVTYSQSATITYSVESILGNY